ncbi:DUF21 domain-containing protein [Capsicum baccatum]|uniref:DUF21 domain-containing protein n=1 Tax=Capsicum baccatum TaxID=33114 RepID=A0A2G2X6W7_CAPBA|nr:DUF21 domain-containing protein [Capsicum baccatum]
MLPECLMFGSCVVDSKEWFYSLATCGRPLNDTVLDWMLGKSHAALLRRAELKTFVDFHGNEAGKWGDLTHDKTTIIAGALELMEKTAKDTMTPISKIDIGYVLMRYGALLWDYAKRKLEAGIKDNTAENLAHYLERKKGRERTRSSSLVL